MVGISVIRIYDGFGKTFLILKYKYLLIALFVRKLFFNKINLINVKMFDKYFKII